MKISKRQTGRENKKAFTLLETLIALAIFSGMLVAISGMFGGFVRNYRTVKEVQKNLENAQFAMNYMAKVLRTGTILSPSNIPATAGTVPASSSSIVVFDNSQNRCVRFEFDGTDLLRQEKAGPIGNCLPVAGYSAVERMVYKITGLVTTQGRFSYPINTNNNAGSNWKVGAVTISMDIGDQTNTRDLVHIQTTVSLRDYSLTN